MELHDLRKISSNKRLSGIFLPIILLLFSCSQNNESTENEERLSTNNSNLSSSNSGQENLDRIQKKYGIQWDFCDCVKKNDSIDRLLKKQKLSDAQLEEILLRADEIDKKCKVLLTDLKSNKPMDRAKHQAKVRECLEQ